MSGRMKCIEPDPARDIQGVCNLISAGTMTVALIAGSAAHSASHDASAMLAVPQTLQFMPSICESVACKSLAAIGIAMATETCPPTISASMSVR